MKANKFFKYLLLLLVVFGIVAMLRNPGRFGSYINRVDRNDHRAVAQQFVTKNGFIAKRIGKVEQFNYVADGGGSGRTSYNVFRLTGRDKTGSCDLTLQKDDDGKWHVTFALLTVEGTEYKIPIKRTGKRKLPKIL